MGVYSSTARQQPWLLWSQIAAALLGVLHFVLQRRQAASLGTAIQSRPQLRIAIFNQVNFHLHVVAGVMHVLQPMTSAPITVYLTSKVLNENWYGFSDWLGKKEGFEWKDCKDYDTAEKYDLIWFISPEWDPVWISQVAQQMSPKMALYYVHNGHMPDNDFSLIKSLSPDLPLVTMGPHVAQFVRERLQSNRTAGAASTAEWVLPIYPYQPDKPCDLSQMQIRRRAGRSCLSGFSITGSMDPSLRNYTRMWEQISSYRQQQGAAALANFKLNILGEVVENFTVPEDVKHMVTVYMTPPDPEFYDVNYHSYGLVPALANPAYYTSKLTSAVITSLMTGTPIIADSAFLSAYSMMEPTAVFQQGPGQNELDVMFKVAAMPPEEIWQTRAAVERLRSKVNERASSLILGWMMQKGLVPDADSEVVTRFARKPSRVL